MTHKITALIAALFLAAAPAALADDASVSGSLSLDLNTHFISYGADVWSAGDDWQDSLFNPAVDITWDLGNGVSLYTGIWADINDNATDSLGGNFQELDWWFGASFGLVEDLTIDIVFQQWYFASETEGIIDVILAYDAPILAPTLTIHNRIEENGAQKNGTVVDLGISHTIEVEGVSITIPANIAWASDEYNYKTKENPADPTGPEILDFHGKGGFAYVNIGLDVSVPLTFIPEELGSWDVHGGVKYWHTDEDVIPGNPEDNFVTGTIGIGTSF